MIDIANFMFCTGIENSSPTINQGRTRIDQLELCGHDKRWREDFGLVKDLGIEFLRYGPSLHKTYVGPGRYDWSVPDEAFRELKRLNITPIVDLCHFGVPDWIGNFQNPDLPALFSAYADAFAERYPWIQLYTPMNEMFICAAFSAQYGWWNEQLSSDTAFVTALKHIVKANVLAMKTILQRQPNAIFIQSESTEYFHADSPAAIGPAEKMNSKRFLSLDLNYGRRVDSEMYEYLLDNGMTRDEYHFFLSHRHKQHCILGNDYYVTNEHRVHASGRRYYYYISRAFIEGRRDEIGSIPRVAASDIEPKVVAALRQVVLSTEDPAMAMQDDRSVVEGALEQVTIRKDGIRMELKAEFCTSSQLIVEIPWKRKPSRPSREILFAADGSADSRPIRAKARKSLIKAIAQGRTWLQELVTGKTADIETIAAREGRSERSVQMTLSLAFLAPDIVEAAIMGSLPRGLGVTRLVDMPLSWAAQRQALSR